jgi:glycosyltransferase involved in cell wall biosynthesis
MRLAQELNRRGYEAAIFTRSPAERHPEAPEIAVIGEEGPTSLLVAERLRRRIRGYGPSDLIIEYTPHMLGASRWGSPAVLWLMSSMRSLGVNVVLLAHELFLPWRLRPDLALGAASTRMQLAALMRAANRTLVTMDMRVSEVASFSAVLRLPLPGVVRVGPNAIPLPPVRRHDRLRLGVFSTLASTKRFDVVLDCFAEVQRVRPTAELVLLGDLGDQHNGGFRRLHEAIQRHPAAARIHVPGRLDLGEVARQVAEIDVYLFPMVSGANTRSGTLPLALGTGLPVVATRGYETDSLFIDGVNVLFADMLSGSEFARAVLRLTEDDSLRERLYAGARRCYDQHFSWERIGEQFLAQI